MSIGDPLTFNALFVGAFHGGIHHFAGLRAIIVDATLIGLTRRGLIADSGMLATKQLLLHLGYAQGWRLGGRLVGITTPHTEESIAHTVRRLLGLIGLADTPFDAPDQGSVVTVAGSCEAEEHVRHCGPSDEPVCWFAAGYISGYLSRTLGVAVVCREDLCQASGHPVCTFHIDARTGTALDVVNTDPFDRATSAYLLLALTGDVGVPDSHRDPHVGDLEPGTRSAAMRALLMLARRAAPGETTVLLTGESGVGKEFLARDVHAHSERARGPFVPVNCGALSEALLESELFGHTRGSFTGAVADKKGLFETAHGGTLFLDEIGEMRPDVQVKLLRVLQDHELRRVGDVRMRPIDVRVIAATNRDLHADVTAKRFRDDLYYRLAVVTFHVPPLRERDEDLRDLTDLFMRRLAERSRRPGLQLTTRARAALMSHHWPGNIRELMNALESAAALTARTTIDVADLPAHLRTPVLAPAAVGDSPALLWQMERDHIFAVLRRARGNRTRAAAQLGIGIKTLYRKLRRYGWLEPDPAPVGHTDRRRSE